MLGFQELTSYFVSTNPQIKLCEQLGHREVEMSVVIWPKAEAPKWTWNRKGLGVSKDRLEICVFMSLNRSTLSTIKIVIVQSSAANSKGSNPFHLRVIWPKVISLLIAPQSWLCGTALAGCSKHHSSSCSGAS